MSLNSHKETDIMKKRHARKFIYTSLLLTFLLLGSCSWPSDETSKARLVLEPCSPEIEGQKDLAELNALCGEYEVSENRETNEGRKITLNVAVIPSLAKAKPDPIFLLAGGPGQAATENPWMIMPWVKKLRTYRDIVLVDQRGTGSSNPLDCMPDGELAFEEMFKVRIPSSEIAKCVQSYDADLTRYTTDIAMDDLNEVREALGYGKINIYGGSYGTRAALVYLRRHEDTVRSLVIEAVAPMEMKIGYFAAEDAERAIGLLLTHCEEDGECSNAFPGLRGKLSGLISSLEETPAEVELAHPRTGELHKVTVGVETLRMVLFSSLYDTVRAALIPLSIIKAYDGDFSVIAALLEMQGRDAENISGGMQAAVLCNEDLAGIDEDLPDAGSSLNVFSKREMVSFFSEHCDFFKGANLPDSYFAPVKSTVPALVLSGEMDPITPPRWGETASANLKRSKHVVVPGMGHGVSSNMCVSNMIVETIENASAESIEMDCLKGISSFPVFLKNTGPVTASKKVNGQ